MKVGDLVRFREVSDGLKTGLVIRIDEDYYGARQAYKIAGERLERGKCIRPDMLNIIAPTEKGIRDRVLVLWIGEAAWEYCEAPQLEVVSEGW